MTDCRGDDASVLAAAFELIDEVYGSVRTGDRSRACQQLWHRLAWRRPHVECSPSPIDELQPYQCTLKRFARAEDVMESVPALRQVGESQHAEETREIDSSTEEATRQQVELAAEIHLLITGAQAMLQTIVPTKYETTFALQIRLLPELQRRLDAVRDQFGPLDSVQGRYRMTSFYPFQLSTIVNEMWKALHENARGEIRGQPDHDEQGYGFCFKLCKPLVCMETQGWTALQRTYLPDGSVLLAFASTAKGAEVYNNIVAGLEVYETLWMWVGRCDPMNPRSRVFIQTSNHIIVQPRASGSPAVDMGQRLQQFKAFADGYSHRNDGKRQQALENRFLTSRLGTR